MLSYIIRRLLLSIPTFFGVTIIFFIFLQMLPGGPVEQAMMEVLFRQQSGEGGGTNVTQGNESLSGISPKVLARLREYYGVDKPILVRYLIWLGLWPREVDVLRLHEGEGQRLLLRTVYFDSKTRNLQRWVSLRRSPEDQLSLYISPVGLNFAHPDSRYQALPGYEELLEAGNQYWQEDPSFHINDEGEGLYKVYRLKLRGVLQGYLGDSYSYSEPVASVIMRRMPISLWFGLTGLLLTYLVAIPLGMSKAVHHRSWQDSLSTFWVFLGYAIPGYILGIFLISFFTAGGVQKELLQIGSLHLSLPLPIFPVGDFVSGNFKQLNFGGKVLDLLRHMVLPTIAWNIGSFAALTMLMKNTVLDELSQDYVRTAFAKGLSEKHIIYRHVFKNALVPIAPQISRFFFIFFTGSMLIERTFNIQGMGLLSFNAMYSRDYPIVMGFTMISTLISLLAGIVGDLMYAVVDPRIRFR